MSDFSTVQKYLRRSVAREITAAEAIIYNTRAGSTNPAKYQTRGVPARDIKLIFETITLPSFSVASAGVSAFVPRLLFQYNITSLHDFAITRVINKVALAQGCLTVKWRVGNTVYRYLIAGKDTVTFVFPPPDHEQNVIYFEDYTNQQIPHNFCIEFWSMLYDIGAPLVGLLEDIEIETSILAEPSTADELTRVIAANVPIEFATMSFNLPVALPVVQPSVAYLDN